MILNPRSCKYTAPNSKTIKIFIRTGGKKVQDFSLCLGLVTSALFWSNAPANAREILVKAQAQSSHPQLMAQVTMLFVDPNNGQDTANNGSDRAPLKTITYALSIAAPNTVILLAPGTYSNATGETFPLRLKPGVTLQGDPGSRGQNIVIKGGGLFISPSFADQNVAILGENQAGLTGVTVTNPNDRGYGLWIESTNPIILDNTFAGNNHDGISITGSSTSVIRNNYFYQNGANGITIYGTARPELRENIFDRTGYGINIAQNAMPVIISNRITQNRSGVVAQANARPILRNNVIEGNLEDGLVAIANAQPDLGTSTEQGGNIFRNNGRLDINAKATSQTIPAFGNQVASSRINGHIDLAGTLAPISNLSIQPQTYNNTSNVVPAVPISPTISLPPVQISQVTPLRSSNRITTKQIPARQLEPIQIPVPLPNPSVGQTAPQVNLVATTSYPAQTAAPQARGSFNKSRAIPDLPSITPGLLPVPNDTIPSIYAEPEPVRVPQNEITPGSPPPPPNYASVLGFRYRVVVELENDAQKTKVRSLVPDAFMRVFNGRSVMQVGAYTDREQGKAERMLQLMKNNGFKASIEQLE